jgi:hypothetical protein
VVEYLLYKAGSPEFKLHFHQKKRKRKKKRKEKEHWPSVASSSHFKERTVIWIIFIENIL